MSKPRAIAVSCKTPTRSVCVVGTEVAVDVYGSAPPGAGTFDIQGCPGVEFSVVYHPPSLKISKGEGTWLLESSTMVMLTTTKPSTDTNDIKVNITYYGHSRRSALGSAMLYLTSVEVSLNVDTHRTGVVSSSGAEKASWTWGPDGHGAVLLVNCDRDNDNSTNMDSVDTGPPNYADVKDMSRMLLRTCGPDAIFKEHSLTLHISKENMDKVRVFQEQRYLYKHVLGGEKINYELQYFGQEETTFFVEGLTFPDLNFSGLVSICVTLQERSNEVSPDAPIFTDEVVFQMAPWIMTPNTMEPLEVFVCSVPENGQFLEQVSSLVKKVKCKLTICSGVDNRGDRWIQDEMEFGYIEAPQKSFPVVFDSPRNGKLNNFPFKRMLGPDFGYVTKEPEDPSGVSSLDSFGNLEISPPVSVNGKEYPLGRIIIGGQCPNHGGLEMVKVVQDFLHAQQVQAPLTLWSDWLCVGHVDEFLTFIPAPDRKGFRLLLASTTACYQLLQQKKDEGHGDTAMFQGVTVESFTINQILSNKTLEKENKYVQSCIDWNRDILKQNLGLTEEDIIDIPALFKLDEKGLAGSFFPDMVNMLVLEKQLGIPKPFGPIIDGKCCLEEEVRCLLEPLGLNCNFIDDFYPYHLLCGEVHCGTNVRRKPFAFKWWNMTP